LFVVGGFLYGLTIGYLLLKLEYLNLSMSRETKKNWVDKVVSNEFFYFLFPVIIVIVAPFYLMYLSEVIAKSLL